VPVSQTNSRVVYAALNRELRPSGLFFPPSPGGSADSGFAIYDSLRFFKPPVRTVVNGLCASAAVMIYLAAPKERRFSLPARSRSWPSFPTGTRVSR
jgi:hypothetical protein